MSEILLSAAVSRGSDWIWNAAEEVDYQEVKYLDSYGTYHDDISGNRLDTAAVVAARQEELGFIRSYNVYVHAPIGECWKETGKGPISTKWIDTNKGDVVHPNIRSRFVAREIAHDKDTAMFAATPPLEANKLLYSLAVTEGIGYFEGDRAGGMCLMFIDIKRAFFQRQCEASCIRRVATRRY